MEDKIYFQPGQLVTLKQSIPHRPIMLVCGKALSYMKSDDPKSVLRGIKCRWFTSTGELQEAIWNTKDIQLIK